MENISALVLQDKLNCNLQLIEYGFSREYAVQLTI